LCSRFEGDILSVAASGYDLEEKRGEPMAEGIAAQDQTQEKRMLLYPIFKGEVYRRRESMMQITRTGCVVLFLFLALLSLLPHPPLKPTIKGLLFTGVTLFTGMFLYQLRIQNRRHAEAKRQLIDLERALGLFGKEETERSIYPSSWKEPSPNWILPIFAGGMVVLTIFCWIEIWAG
jgi:hypothetical protein